MLAAIEALFIVDFFERIYNRKKGQLSRTFRELYKQQTKNRIGLNAIFKEWINAEDGNYSKLINALQGAFKYRHWLAHGLYWVPKYDQKYDFDSVYVLARETFEILNKKIILDHFGLRELTQLEFGSFLGFGALTMFFNCYPGKPLKCCFWPPKVGFKSKNSLSLS